MAQHLWDRDSARWSATRVTRKPRPHRKGASGNLFMGSSSLMAVPSRCTKPALIITAQPCIQSSHADSAFLWIAGPPSLMAYTQLACYACHLTASSCTAALSSRATASQARTSGAEHVAQHVCEAAAAGSAGLLAQVRQKHRQACACSICHSCHEFRSMMACLLQQVHGRPSTRSCSVSEEL